MFKFRFRFLFLLICLYFLFGNSRHSKSLIPSNTTRFGVTKGEIPKRIWTFWNSEKIPWMINACIKTWRESNPDYEINILTIPQVRSILKIPLPHNFEQVQVQFQADWIRLAILSQEGGIWMDASMIVTGPLKYIHQLQEREESEGVLYYLER
jgi:mannosyltransferase OCH1-like enzyme